MTYPQRALTDSQLECLLREDAPYGDLTVASLGIGHRPGRILFRARDPLVACGLEEAARLLELAGAVVEMHEASGLAADPGRLLLAAAGPAASLFLAWKVAQSLVESASGISTAARRLVEGAGEATVACTRKHFPGIKPMAVKAVRCGGATMHRLGLSETVMVTAEHRLFLEPGDAGAAQAEDYPAALGRALPEKKVVVEVDRVADALALVARGCAVIQLEKLAPAQVAEVAAAVGALPPGAPRPVIAAAGGIHPGNAADYAAAGAQVLVTSAPFFAGPRDVQVRFERAVG